MSFVLPKRLLAYVDGKFSIIDPPAHGVHEFHIVSYTWGTKVPQYDPGIAGLNWTVKISPERLNDIKRLMQTAGLKYLWVDCVCINQDDEEEKMIEIAKMYRYYKSALQCHILVHMDEVWYPQQIVEDLRFVDHILSYMGGAALAKEARLGENLTSILNDWEHGKWMFPVDKGTVRSAGIELGILNCYATSIYHVITLFHNLYFSRVWTFQEMLLGKEILMWGVNTEIVREIGELDTWMDLATACTDKAYKLQAWIEIPRVLKPNAVNAVLRVIEEHKILLGSLQTQVKGISSARTDIIAGGPNWWEDNHKGISNIFSAISITPRECNPDEKADVFKGLLGVFSGLFTAEEIGQKMNKNRTLDEISFAFFQQLSLKTDCAWTRLSISSGERESWDWIPVVADSGQPLTTDCFSGVVNLGRAKANGLAKSTAVTGLIGTPRPYMKIKMLEGDGSFRFVFKGCNCGKKVKTSTFGSERIPTMDQCRDVVKDETGRMLVQCATLLGSILDPVNDVVKYRRNLLRKLQPDWNWTDPSAKPTLWADRCVSGTTWENPHPEGVRAHNWSMNYNFVDIFDCGSRLYNKATANLLCEVTINCGCTITGPFVLMIEALTAVHGSFLGDTSAALDSDNRIVLRDGMGLIQVGDVGKAFNVVAFGGDVGAYKSYASTCRSTKRDKTAPFGNKQFPYGRALVRDEFSHGIGDVGRDYGYVETGGSGNLLIYRGHPMGKYKIVGVCIDEHVANKKGRNSVVIR
ncbi:unnamed protein product [Clonostachys rhizophaga]|uniref:Heterokaryon incompatibility domain-containing protein n=1 Tax=Clonostachys rhizophaga TaxID=160324 RepID=A0A9N9VF41_9HYPO|nr:unnamed protein product [Clonostachys rhizophaga]